MNESEKRIPPFGLRLPPDLKERVQAAARASKRSMNAEIIARLEKSLATQAVIEEMGRLLADVAARTEKLEQQSEKSVDADG